jgi:hypothetical protein
MQEREHRGSLSREIWCFAYHNLLDGKILRNEWGAVHFFEVEYTTAEKGLPHSKQLAFDRDVINPHDGHIICDWNPANCGFSLRLQRSSRIVNRTMSRPTEILVAFMKAIFLCELASIG